jgi:hypothetical protein
VKALAIDRFVLPARLEKRAQEIASEIGVHQRDDFTAPFLLGYLKSSVATSLERPRLLSRDRLAVDLRVVQILWDGSRR